MKIFHCNARVSWADNESVNFVDDNEVAVGFSVKKHCCETFGFTVSPRVGDTGNWAKEEEFPGYQFDPSFVEEDTDPAVDDEEEHPTQKVSFRLVCEDKPDLFLTLYNCHNGYYAHGFTVKIKGEVVNTGEV
jgi:hypothetical protein